MLDEVILIAEQIGFIGSGSADFNGAQRLFVVFRQIHNAGERIAHAAVQPVFYAVFPQLPQFFFRDTLRRNPERMTTI